MQRLSSEMNHGMVRWRVEYFRLVNQVSHKLWREKVKKISKNLGQCYVHIGRLDVTSFWICSSWDIDCLKFHSSSSTNTVRLRDLNRGNYYLQILQYQCHRITCDCTINVLCDRRMSKKGFDIAAYLGCLLCMLVGGSTSKQFYFENSPLRVRQKGGDLFEFGVFVTVSLMSEIFFVRGCFQNN